MTKNLRTVLVLVAVLVVAGVLVRQEKEMHRLQTAIAELAGTRSEATAVSPADPNPLPDHLEELRRAASEVQILRAEVAQLHREKVETSALQARLEALAATVDSMGRGGNVSPAVSQATFLARSSAKEAAKWVAALPEGEEKLQAALAVIERWIGSDPTAAAAWTTQLPDGPLREETMYAVSREWALRDWNATAAWLETLPSGSSRDRAIGAFVTSADGSDIKLALEWANRMDDPESRNRRVEGTARRWLKEDNAAARAWIEKAQLPAGMAERLLLRN